MKTTVVGVRGACFLTLGFVLLFGISSGVRPAAAYTGTVEQRITSSTDDAEESNLKFNVKLTSTSLDLVVVNTTPQTVGMRWTGLAIPTGATITSAYIQFSANASQSASTNLTVRAQAADNPPTFTTSKSNISLRPRTTAAMTWSPASWTSGQAGANQRTPDMSAVIQEVVGRAGWASGNAIVVIVTGTGHRAAWAWDGNAGAAPLLHIEYSAVDKPPVARLSVTQVFNPGLIANADGSASTDTDPTPVASYQFDFGDGTPVSTTTAPTAKIQHTYAAAGTYTVTLVATDTGGLASTPVTASVTVNVNHAPVLSQPSDMTVNENVVANQSLSATDSDGQALTFSLVSGPAYATVTTTAPGTGTATGNLRLAPGFSNAGTAIATVRASDGSLTDAKSLTITVNNVNRAPTLNQPGNMLVVQGATSDQVLTGADPDGDALTFTKAVGPAFMTVTTTNATTGNIHLAPAASEPTGSQSATVTATDNGTPNLSSSKTLTIQVRATNSPPVLSQPANMTVTAGTTADQTLNATDPDANALTFSLVSGPTYATVTTTTPGTGTATGNLHLAPGSPDIGTATATVSVTDGAASDSKSLTITVQAGAPVMVYVGYYDTHHHSRLQPRPDPWQGSSNVVFVGTPDNQPGDPVGGGWDASAVRVDNTSAGTLTGVVVTVDIGTKHYALWGSHSDPPGGHLILTQTAFENFDGSDTNPAGCYACDTLLCLTKVVSTIPVVHVTVNGVTTDYIDSGQFLNTHGVDSAGCPWLGGKFPDTRYDESEAWQRIYPASASASSLASASASWSGSASSSAPTSASMSAARPKAASSMPGEEEALQLRLWLKPPATNPTQGHLSVRFATPVRGMVQISVYDVSGRLVRPCVDNVLDAATYEFQVDLSQEARGIYFLNMRTASGTRNMKIALVH